MMRWVRSLIPLLLLIPAAGCEREVTSPAAAQELLSGRVEGAVTEYAQMTERDLLISVLQRMDALEARVARESAAAQARIEELVGGSAGLPIAFAAERERSRGTEQCLEIKVGAESTFGNVLDAAGDAFAGLGAWAGSGASANIDLEAKVRATIEPLKAAVELKKAWCFGRDVTNDPFIGGNAGGGSARAAAAPAPLALETEIAAVIDRLGMTEARAVQALGHLSDNGTGLPTCLPGNCAQALAQALPIPTDLRGILGNPTGFFREKAQDLGGFTIDQMCGGLFPGAFGARMDQACDLRGRFPDTEQLIDAYDALSGIPALVAQIDDRLAVVCSRTRNLIDGVNGFSIEKHSIFSNNIRWPGPDVPVLGTNCSILRT